MSRSSLLTYGAPPSYAPYSLELGHDEGLAVPCELEGVSGGFRAASVAYRQSRLGVDASRMRAADVPAGGVDYQCLPPAAAVAAAAGASASASATASATAHAHAHAHAHTYAQQQQQQQQHQQHHHHQYQRRTAAAEAAAAAAVAAATATQQHHHYHHNPHPNHLHHLHLSHQLTPPLRPLQLLPATLCDLERREWAKRRHLRGLPDRDRDRTRPRKQWRAATRAARYRDSMEGNTADFGMSEEDLAEMQKLSESYQPDVTGPEVSERISTEAIAAEYARADPSYQVKTASIPQSFPYYRRCKGDGHCGWRAIAFCYYETLLHLGSKQKFREEETRLRSLSNLFSAVGHDKSIWEMWEDEVLELLTALADAPSVKEGEAILLGNFNEGPQATWQSIITYLKTLTSSWIRTRREDYEPFMGGMTVEEYCGTHIDPYQAEMEHVGLSALADVLLKPAHFALEVHYLDRSAGTEPFVHRFDPADTAGVTLPNTPTIRLLYRPGHYDILYAYTDTFAQATSASAANSVHQANGDVFVGLASPSDESPHGLQSTPLSYAPFADGLALIPGMSLSSAPGLGSTQGSWVLPAPTVNDQYSTTRSYDYQTPMKVDYTQPVQAQPAPPPPPPQLAAPLVPQAQRIAPAIEGSFVHRTSVSAASRLPITLPAPPTFIDASPTGYRQHSRPVTSAPSVQHGRVDRGAATTTGMNSIFRPSRFEYESRWSEATLGGPNSHGRDLGFQTSIFRNSHFNIAHFNNPDFEPEQWTPEQDVCERGRRRSLAH